MINDHYASVRGLDVPTRQVAAERRDHACGQTAAACDSGKDPFACRIHGLCLAEDWPQRKAPRDVNAAAAALGKACDQGDAQGCAELGFLRLREDGDSALAQAYAAHERGCKLESATSCVAAATQAQFGLGTRHLPGGFAGGSRRRPSAGSAPRRASGCLPRRRSAARGRARARRRSNRCRRGRG